MDDIPKTLKLWRTCPDTGRRLLIELCVTMFPDQDAYQEAIDFHMARGASETYKED